jgi:hypothetical protein
VLLLPAHTTCLHCLLWRSPEMRMMSPACLSAGHDGGRMQLDILVEVSSC